MTTSGTSLDKAKSRLIAKHGRARFWAFGDEAAMVDPLGNTVPLRQVWCYDHSVSNAIERIPGHTFQINNGFLTSHAYNVAFCYLATADDELRQRRLRHNFKKFYSEVFLNTQNRMIGRAFLLETLLFEQGLMQPLFSVDQNLSSLAQQCLHVMTTLTEGHELGHFLLEGDRDMMRDDINALFAGQGEQLLAEIGMPAPRSEGEEALCDLMALQTLFLVSDPAEAPLRVLRQALMGWEIIYTLIELQRSARQCAASQPKDRDVVKLGSHMRSQHEPEFIIGRVDAIGVRRQHVRRAIEGVASTLGLNLFGDDGSFPLTEQMFEDFDQAFQNFGEEDDDPTLHHGIDRSARNLVRIVAESLTGHDEGVEHLLWRSKRFSIGETPVDP